MEWVRVSELFPSLVYLPLQAWPHIPLIDGSRPLQPLRDRPVPPELSKVSWPGSASQAMPSSSDANRGAAGLFVRRKPAKERPQHHHNVIRRITSILSLTVQLITPLNSGCKYVTEAEVIVMGTKSLFLWLVWSVYLFFGLSVFNSPVGEGPHLFNFFSLPIQDLAQVRNNLKRDIT